MYELIVDFTLLYIKVYRSSIATVVTPFERWSPASEQGEFILRGTAVVLREMSLIYWIIFILKVQSSYFLLCLSRTVVKSLHGPEIISTLCLVIQFLREELKYDSGYEKRHKTFHYNDDTQISVKELWEAWLRSEVNSFCHFIFE